MKKIDSQLITTNRFSGTPSDTIQSKSMRMRITQGHLLLLACVQRTIIL